MKKSDLVAAVSQSTGKSLAETGAIVDAVIDQIVATMKRGEEVRLTGFGSFTVTKRAASKGRNPRTGEIINVPASKQPRFKAGKSLKDAVNSR